MKGRRRGRKTRRTQIKERPSKQLSEILWEKFKQRQRNKENGKGKREHPTLNPKEAGMETEINGEYRREKEKYPTDS